MKPSLQYLLVATVDCAASLLACPNTVREINAKYFCEYSFEFKGGKGEGGGRESHFAIIWAYSEKYLLMYLTLSMSLSPSPVHQHISASK